MGDKIIKYQNDSEKNFEKKKNIKTIINYIISLIIFFLSTIISAYSFPFRFIYKKLFRRSFESKIMQLNDKNIDSVLKKEKLVLIDFWAQKSIKTNFSFFKTESIFLSLSCIIFDSKLLRNNFLYINLNGKEYAEIIVDKKKIIREII